jgi:hypothetical protein
MLTFRQFIKENTKSSLWHGSMNDNESLRPGMHIGTREQAEQRFSDVTAFRKDVPVHFYRVTEKVPRSPEHHIEIEDNGSPSLATALFKASQQNRIPANIARIASKKSAGEQARTLIKYGIHRVTYQNKYEGKGRSHIIVNPGDYEMEKGK